MKIKQQILKPSAVALSVLMACSAAPVMANTGSGFIDNSKVDFNLRYRTETVSQDGKAEDALASTLKARASFQSGLFNNFKVSAEVDHVMTLGADDYNDASGIDPKGQYPVVADPTGTDLNQFNVGYYTKGLTVIAGRQRIVLGNQRFVGGVAWRQNEQTFDGIRAKYNFSNTVSVDYSFVNRVNRIFGPDGAKAEADGTFQLANVHFKLPNKHKVTGFAYLLDYDNSSDPMNTFGADYVGKFGPVAAHASYAIQSFGDFDASYFAADGAMAVGPAKVTLGMEQLGSDGGNYGFKTPLATAHKFQGFADKFLGTPNTGVNDYYAKVAGKAGPVKLVAAFHSFSAVEGDADYGTEVNLVANYKVHKTTAILAKFASYSADSLASDTTKFWLMVNTKL